MTRSFAAISAAIVAAIALAVSAAPASATTWHHTWSYLHFPATEADEGYMPIRGPMTLNGFYEWRNFIAHEDHLDQPRSDDRNICLRGEYTWSDGLFAVNGMYHHKSYLQNAATGGKAWLDHTAVVGAFGDGRYHWGSTLDRIGSFGANCEK